VGRGAGADGSNAIAVDAGVQAVELVEDVTEAVHDGAIAVDGGINTGCAVLESGEVCAWGWNGAGQLGDGTTTDRRTPVAVSGGLSITAIAAGGSSTCGMRGNAIWCWGSNRSGQLGNSSSTAISPNPIGVSAPFDKP